MRKLKLESLHVESFETTAPAPGARGTVDGHAVAPDTNTGCNSAVSQCAVCEPISYNYICVPLTYDVQNCGETNYLDCTYGCSYRCSYNTGCRDICWADADTLKCAVD